MKTKTTLIGALSVAALGAFANQQPTGNDNPTYAPSNVQAQLRLDIRQDTDTVHFIRDTNDPKILTKTYVLKHASPYAIRPYVREMVQAQRVDYNNTMGRSNTAYFNTYSKGTLPLFVPCSVECIEYTDGTGVLIISAEDYRFKSNENGMGIDEIVANLDRPDIKNSAGQPKYIYFPSFRSAADLQTMLKNVGANVSNDTVELIGGKDKIEIDKELNCLFFNTALYSRKNIETMLGLYDIPLPEVKVSVTVYELDSENDGMLGLDFQSWKNNDGVKLFSAGTTFSRNYNLNNLGASVIDPSGTVNSHYFNFQPKWNTKYLDFLVSKGKAKLYTTGELAVLNGKTATLARSNGVLAVVPEKITAHIVTPAGTAKESGNKIEVDPVDAMFQFNLSVTPLISSKATTLTLTVASKSVLGTTSDGQLRSANYTSSQKVMLGNGANTVYLGGVDKSQVVRDVGGVPLLKDLPVLGWLFSTERESTKKSSLVVVANCELVMPDAPVGGPDLDKIEPIRKSVGSDSNRYGYGQLLLDPER